MVIPACLFEPSGGNYDLVLKLNELSYMTQFMKQQQVRFGKKEETIKIEGPCDRYNELMFQLMISNPQT